MIIGHQNHSGSAMGSNCTEDTVKGEDRCSKENKCNYSGNTMPIHGNAQKLTKTSNVSSLSKSGKKVLHSKRCFNTVFARKGIPQHDCI